MQTIETYLRNANRLLATGNATEHSYRGDLQTLLNHIINDDDIIVTNEPARITNVGAPDYSITKNNIALGYIEAKDIGADDLEGKKKNKEQFDRYKNALPNLIITDYLNFWFYKNGKFTHKIAIATIEDNTIIPKKENFQLFVNHIKDFTSFVSQSITSPLNLAKLMAGKARLLEDVLTKAILSDDEENEADISLKNQMEIFKDNLIHDITPQAFADVYAQTIAYGMFVARLHDKTLDTFSRQEAVFLIPKTNPFLQGLFSYISGVDCDDRLIWIIDSLAEIFLATDISQLLNGFGKKSGQEDAIIHFYETFLGEYNPKLRKSRGVWYTPQAVVSFIVRACDEVLKVEFGIEDGLVDESKITIKAKSRSVLYNKDGSMKKDQNITKEVHRVQVLDPATGTGTFLAETIKLIKKNFWGGSWSAYVEEHLIPRLNGFELLMASYAMAHLKLDLLLLETGYKPINQKRFNIFLTNSLEEATVTQNTLFQWFAKESIEANKVKHEAPIMIVMGNPPYAVSSSNKGDWIQNLVKDYKKDLNERNIQPLSDDYIKFIRYGQHYIEKNGEGILTYISNNSFIDGIIHRQMRKSLLECFDKIYILDLHGNSKKKEVCPDGSKDENVFDIMQGVSINIFIKNKINTKKLADLYHYDLYGKRENKYNYLSENSLKSIEWSKLECIEPNYFFVYKNFGGMLKYSKYINMNELFLQNSIGIATGKDVDLVKFTINEFKEEFSNKIRSFFYRPFDIRYTIFDNKILQRARYNHMKHYINNKNIGLNIVRQSKLKGSEILVNNDISNRDFITNHTYNYPLYLYPDENSLLEPQRTPNLNQDIIKDIEKKLKLRFTNEKEEDKTTFAPIDILDYIYAVLHSPNYREKYKEFLKIDFPRVPYPSIDTFWTLIGLGSQLRALHLMESKQLDERIIDIEGEGEMIITNKLNKKDFTIEDNIVTLRINDEVSISNIPLISWEFYIGGYQPAQKWLKDRVGRTLSRTDMKHYNKIINALLATHKLMGEIDEVLG
ncbi:MAG: N-6 DNA methylase [Sulfurovum sp.]